MFFYGHGIKPPTEARILPPSAVSHCGYSRAFRLEKDLFTTKVACC
jgi:hypothetical protein